MADNFYQRNPIIDLNKINSQIKKEMNDDNLSEVSIVVPTLEHAVDNKVETNFPKPVTPNMTRQFLATKRLSRPNKHFNNKYTYNINNLDINKIDKIEDLESKRHHQLGLGHLKDSIKHDANTSEIGVPVAPEDALKNSVDAEKDQDAANNNNNNETEFEDDDEEDEEEWLANLSPHEINALSLAQLVREGKAKRIIALLNDKIYKSKFRMQLKKVDSNGLTPLHYAAKYNQVECAYEILNWAARKNNDLKTLYKTRGKDGMLPLHLAAKSIQISQILEDEAEEEEKASRRGSTSELKPPEDNKMTKKDSDAKTVTPNLQVYDDDNLSVASRRNSLAGSDIFHDKDASQFKTVLELLLFYSSPNGLNELGQYWLYGAAKYSPNECLKVSDDYGLSALH